MLQEKLKYRLGDYKRDYKRYWLAKREIGLLQERLAGYKRLLVATLYVKWQQERLKERFDDNRKVG